MAYRCRRCAGVLSDPVGIELFQDPVPFFWIIFLSHCGMSEYGSRKRISISLQGQGHHTVSDHHADQCKRTDDTDNDTSFGIIYALWEAESLSDGCVHFPALSDPGRSLRYL